MRSCSLSSTAEEARICQNGGWLGSSLQMLQVEYTTFDSSLMRPLVRRAPLAASLPFSASCARMPRRMPSFMPAVSSA